jgi:hypothetical protein
MDGDVNKDMGVAARAQEVKQDARSAPVSRGLCLY